ncbi:uncharacterized protein GGS25DRAFT_480878 [Hypoxylon fragiforme]|uniref:uncharacterized protein n=1 Tax=Hypoxylon fragiforme TaxID=63214 RepID=UPI0020C608B7|nr:uncharacterized protein GGS25DRAFT_480878 [Hypoxylon fragiforme]KAI2610981.1 hypothetical protein GGS25DRAFT_480878 [Hypoxylon fragiforme]
MAIPWGTIKSLLIFFGPMLLPKAISYYRSFRNKPQVAGVTVRPIPPKALRALLVLAAGAFVFIVRALIPYFSPENIFVRTQSRLQIPTDVLFNRLASLRPDNILTDDDNSLRAKFVNMESRALYLHYGPEALARCPFCTSDDPASYFYYAVPTLLIPHLVNLIILSVATSDFLAGPVGPKWRTTATVLMILGVTIDLSVVSTYNYQANMRINRLEGLDLFFWTSRILRYLGLGALDLLLATLLYLSSTNRAFVTPISAAERVEAITRQLQTAKGRMSAMGIIKNTTMRDEALRERIQTYWQTEGRLMSTALEDREVIEGINDALQNRINIEDITRDAEAYSSSAIPRLEDLAPQTTVG